MGVLGDARLERNARKRTRACSLSTGPVGPVSKPDDDLLSHARSALSSARGRFTVLFGMGRSGTTQLWSSGVTGRGGRLPGGSGHLHRVEVSARRICAAHYLFVHRASRPSCRTAADADHRCSRQRSFRWLLLRGAPRGVRLCCFAPQSYRVKPHGPLVLVSSSDCSPSTPSLSTSWSTTTLQGGRAPRQISSWDEFPA